MVDVCEQLQDNMLAISMKNEGNYYVVMFTYALTIMSLWQYDAGDCMEKEISMKY